MPSRSPASARSPSRRVPTACSSTCSPPTACGTRARRPRALPGDRIAPRRRRCGQRRRCPGHVHQERRRLAPARDELGQQRDAASSTSSCDSKLLSTNAQVPLGAINNCMNAIGRDAVRIGDRARQVRDLHGERRIAHARPEQDPRSAVADVLQSRRRRDLQAPAQEHGHEELERRRPSSTPSPTTLQYDRCSRSRTGSSTSTRTARRSPTSPVATPAADQVTFQWGAGDYLAPGETAFLYVALKITPGTPAGTQITNTYGVTET